MDDEDDLWTDEGEVVLEAGQYLDFVDYDDQPLFRVTVLRVEGHEVELRLQRAAR